MILNVGVAILAWLFGNLISRQRFLIICIELEKALNTLGVTREQLIMIGILVGTDYNPGVKGIGSKSALRLVKKHKTLGRVLANVKWEAEVDIERIFDFFLDPPVTKAYEIKWKKPNTDKLIAFMVEEHDFSRESRKNIAREFLDD